jgi:hypothetical protein
MSTVDLSVIIIILEGGDSLRGCLQEIERQRKELTMEIIVPCDESLNSLGAFRTEFPSVEFLPVDGRRTYAELRALGVQKSRSLIVAVTEDQCRPHPDWCKEILQSHQQSHAAVGGPVEKDVPDTVLSWAFFFADYVRYMNPIPEGPTNHLTDCNVSYKRETLETISDVWKKEFHEPEVHNALQVRKHVLWFSPRMMVYQRRHLQLGEALKDRFDFGRLFGSGRVQDLSIFLRLVYAIAALMLPPLTVGRVAQNVFKKKRCIPEFFRALPVVMLLNSVWALGECLGYLTGRSASSLTPALENSTGERSS